VFELAGEFDIGSAMPFRSALEEALRGDTPDLIVDLRGVTFMDSRMLGILLDAQSRMRVREGRLALCLGASPARRVLQVARLEDHFDTYDELDDALAA